MTRTAISTVLSGAVLCCLVNAAEAKPARCFTSTDGTYDCRFVARDGKGSFRISARGKSAITLNVDSSGVAFGFADFGGRNVSLPGRYLRSKNDSACWVNDTTQDRVCAW